MPATAEANYTCNCILAEEVAKGRVIPFCGAGVNPCGPPDEVSWRSGERTHLPTDSEPAGYLAVVPVCSAGARL